MRPLLTVFLLLILYTAQGSAFDPPLKNRAKRAKYKIPRYSKKVVRSRLNDMTQIIDWKWNSEIKYCINSYVRGGRKTTEKMLGKTAIYFPIFDYYLRQYDVPVELKAVALVESMLDPKAKSPVGAAGLWQFIPSTGRLFGLKINNYVDERYDVHKASEAAAKYLSELYQTYGNWTLAIAAYNCGPGNLNKAIRKAKSRDFWKFRKHLPKETQWYVPKVLAAQYLINYYYFHDLRPVYPDYTLQLLTLTKVFTRRSFKQIAEETGIPISTIKLLNPSYKKQVIPPSVDGHLLVLPQLELETDYSIGMTDR